MTIKEMANRIWRRCTASSRFRPSASARRLLLPVALGAFASMSTIGHAGLPSKSLAAKARSAPAGVAAPAQIQPSAAAQIAMLQQIKASKTKAQAKIDSRLFMAMMKQKGDARMAALPDFRFVKPEADGRVAVEIAVTKATGARAVLQKLRSIDAVIVTPKRVIFDWHTVRARVRMTDLELLAAMPEVRKVRQAIPAVTHASKTLGPVVVPQGRPGRVPFRNALTRSEGVQAHGTDDAASLYGATGAGQRICVLSDGIDSLADSQASGDLPADILVLPDQAGGGDEGTAMLEIIHDAAPDAELGFATAFNGEASFAQNILDLADAGCTIIVDDIIYLDESPFQDGPVAQSVNTVTANGVLYFSSAGNEGNLADGTSGTWEGDFAVSAAATPTALAGAGELHDFGDGGVSIRVEGGDGGTPVILIWAEHATLDEGFASTDYDLYDLNGTLTTVFDASADSQDGVGGDDFPIEFIGGGAFTGERLVVARFAAGTSTSVPAFNLILFRGLLDATLATTGATRGHSAAANAFSTAATPAADPFDPITVQGPFPNLFTGANESETFSSDGPRRIVLSPTGDELTPGNRTFNGGVLRQKPDITAADGVSTSAPGFATFYGTSAAAPHAAAIAGIVRSALPNLTMPEVRNLLTSTAIDIEVPGVDVTTGVGIVMPVPALQAGGAVGQPSLQAGAGIVTQIVGDGDGTIESNEIFSISLPVSNVGLAAASPVSVQLATTTPGVTLLSSFSGYPDIAAGGTASNSTPFRFRVDPNFLCGTPISFTAALSSNNPTSPQSATFSKPTGTPATPARFSYTGAPIPIPDSGVSVNAPIVVSGVNGAVGDLDVSIDGATCSTAIGAPGVGIDHTFVSDLEVRVVSPTGQVIRVIDNAGSSGNNFCQTVLDDESTGPTIQSQGSAAAPFTGTFRPSSALSGFDGTPANGTWQLQVQDGFAIDTGSIRAVSLIITGPAACNAPALAAPPSVVSVTRVGSSPVNVANVSYTVTFSEAVSGVDAADFAATTTGGTLAGVAVTSVTGSGTTYTVTLGTGTGSGGVRLDVIDNDSITSIANTQTLGDVGAGNGNFVAGDVTIIDRIPPTVALTVGNGQGSPITTPFVLFNVQFDEATGQFTPADVVIGGTARPTSVVVTGTGSAYTVAVSGMTANGTVTASIPAGAITDAAGNPSTASTTATANSESIRPTVGYTLATQSVAEGTGAGSTTVTITATLDFPISSALTVPVVVGAASTATNGTDYSLSATQFSFPAGTTTASITATIVRDVLEEANETIVLQFGTTTGATVGSPASQTITITNDDDATPDAFSFTAANNAALGSVQTSNTVTLAGFNTPTPITVSAGGSYSINGGPFVSTPGTVVVGNTVAARITAATSTATVSGATVTIGGVSSTFTVTTRAAIALAGPIDFTAVVDAERSTVFTSNTVTITALEVPVPIAVSGGEYSLNGGPFTTTAGTVRAGDTVAVRGSSSANAATNTIVGLSVGTGPNLRAAVFSITTAPPSGGGSAGAALLAAFGLAALLRRRKGLQVRRMK